VVCYDCKKIRNFMSKCKEPEKNKKLFKKNKRSSRKIYNILLFEIGESSYLKLDLLLSYYSWVYYVDDLSSFLLQFE